MDDLGRVDRRAFITLVGGSILAAPLAGEAQQAGRVYRVGLIVTTSPVSEMMGSEPVHPSVRAFVQGLRALGYVEGQNLILERRSAEGRFERFGDIVTELVSLKTDVIVAPGDLIPRAATAITTTVPIVMATAEDPVGAGLVQSLARPGGNVTGLMLVVGPEIEGKRLEIFREALPGVSRVASPRTLEGNRAQSFPPRGALQSVRSFQCADVEADTRVGADPALRTWLDSWAGIGRIAVGMHRQGYDLQLTRYL